MLNWKIPAINLSWVLGDQSFSNPQTSADASAFHTYSHKFRKFHLSSLCTCTHRDTSKSSRDHTPLSTSSETSMECPDGCYRTLPVRMGSRLIRLGHKVPCWITFIWTILQRQEARLLSATKNHKSGLCKRACLELAVLLGVDKRRWSPVVRQYRRQKSTNEEQFYESYFLPFKQPFSSRSKDCQIPTLAWHQNFAWLNFSNPFQWLLTSVCTFQQIFTCTQSTFLKNILWNTRDHRRPSKYNTTWICWYGC